VDKELYQMTIHETRRLLDKKEICSKDLVPSVFERIESIESRISAYITIAKDTALKLAEATDEKMARRETDLLTGIPVAVKDNPIQPGRNSGSVNTLRNNKKMAFQSEYR
jgi:aspartyl-tRNA(Asn)/glutamyl-tRNA(Gln) amidotransferase subunit A